MRPAGAVIALVAAAALWLMRVGEAQTQTSVAGDPLRGKMVFERRCTGCHALNAEREGPRLAGVFGRKAGTVPGFDYSAGLKKSGITWDAASLERWLKEPALVVPDTAMDFRVPNAQERADLVAYLRR